MGASDFLQSAGPDGSEHRGRKTVHQCILGDGHALTAVAKLPPGFGADFSGKHAACDVAAVFRFGEAFDVPDQHCPRLRALRSDAKHDLFDKTFQIDPGEREVEDHFVARGEGGRLENIHLSFQKLDHALHVSPGFGRYGNYRRADAGSPDGLFGRQDIFTVHLVGFVDENIIGGLELLFD